MSPSVAPLSPVSLCPVCPQVSLYVLMPWECPQCPHAWCIPVPQVSPCPGCPRGSLRACVSPCLVHPCAQCVPMDPCVLLCVSMPHVSPSVPMPGASLWPMSPHALCVPVDLCVLVCPCPMCPNACCILVPHMSLCPACPKCPHAQCVPMDPCMLLCVSMPQVSPCLVHPHAHCVPMPGVSQCPARLCTCPSPMCPHAPAVPERVHVWCIPVPGVSPS